MKTMKRIKRQRVAAPRLRALIIEDNPGDAVLIKLALVARDDWHFDVDSVATLSAAIDAIPGGEYDVVLVDLGLPDVGDDGPIPALRRRFPGLPLVVLTGMGPHTVRSTVEQGADGHVSKDNLDGTLLVRTVVFAVERARAVQQVRAIVDHNPAAIVVVDKRGAIQFCNPAARTMLGCDEGHVDGRSLPFALRPFSGSVTIPGDGEAGRCADIVVKEIDWGDADAWLATLLDSSDKEAYARELRDSQQRLKNAEMMGTLGRLAGGVAHDFNNLVFAIRSFTEFAMEGMAADDPRRDDLDEVIRAANAAAQVAGQLLAISRRRARSPVRTDVNAITADMRRILRQTVGNQVKITIQPADSALYVDIDAAQLQRVLLNLCMNAGDAMPDGGWVTVRVGIARRDIGTASDIECVEIAVEDAGVGIAEADQARVFEPFFTTKGNEGSGLGLATCLRIAQQAGGTIELKSEVGTGTTVTVVLPVADEPS